MAASRSKGRSGNPDGSPRLELADEHEEDEAILAALKDADEASRETETENPFPAASRTTQKDVSGIFTEESEVADKPVHSYYSKKRAKEQAKETATWLLLILEGAAVVTLGEAAKMSAQTRKMIMEPLERMMARLDPAVNEALQKWTDPILLVFGFATWGLQLYAITKDNEDDDSQPPPKSPSAVVPPGNGKGIRRPTEVDAEEAVWARTGPTKELLSQVDSGGFS